MGAKAVITGDGLFDFFALFAAQITANTLHVRLFKNNIIVDETTHIGDLTECDYTGYAAQDIVLSGLPGFGDGYAEVPGDKASWGPYPVLFPGNSGADQTAFGCYVTYNIGGGGDIMLWMSNCFDEQNTPALVGRNISGSGDVVPLVITTRVWDYVQDQGDVSTFRITGWPVTPLTGVPYDLTVTALNRDRTTNLFYAGTVYMLSTDTAAIFTPGLNTLVSGVGVFNVQLLTGGLTIVAAADQDTPADVTAVGGVVSS